MKNYTFVMRSVGEAKIDGKDVKWDKITLSDGVRSGSIKNNTTISNWDSFVPEVTKVKPIFEIKIVKGERIEPILTGLEIVK